MIVHVDKKEIVAYVSIYTSVTLLLFKDVLPFLQSAVVQALILMTRHKMVWTFCVCIHI